MNSKNKNQYLRQKAEKLLKENRLSKSDQYYEDVEKLIEELNIHQIELELQNQELQEANRKLADEKSRYKALYMDAPVAYFTLNETGNILDLNHAAADLLKTPIQKFRYTSIFPYLEENSKKDFLRYFKDVFKSEKTEFGRIVFKDSHGCLVFANLSSSAYFDSCLNENLVRCTVNDISKIEEFERKIDVQKKLIASEKRIKMLFNGIGVVMLLIDPDSGQIEDTNPAASKFYGYSIEKLKQMNISEINQMSDAEIQAEMERTRQSGKAYFNFKHKLANGRVCDVEVYSNAIALGEETRLFSIVHDITERKAVEEKNKEIKAELRNTIEELYVANEELNAVNIKVSDERKQFLSILDSIPELIYVADIESYEVLFTNKKMKELIGRDITGEKCFRAIQGKNAPCDFCTNKYIKTITEPHIWEYYNPILDRHFHIMDRKIKWTDEKDVRFELAIDITERKKAEEENKKLTIAVEQNPVTIVITDMNANIEYVNPVFSEQTGYTKEEAIGQNPRILNSGKTDPKTYEELWETILSGQIWKGHFINKSKSGEEYIEHAVIAPIFNENNEKTHYIAIKEDVTQKVKIENQIKRNEAIQRIAFESANIGIMNVDRNGKILYANKESSNIFGYADHEFENMSVNDFTVPEDKNVSPRFIQSALKDNTYEKAVFEKRYFHKNGNIIICQISSTLLRDANDEPLYFISHIKDITKQKQVEENLRRSEEKYRLITENASDVIWILNLSRKKFTYISPSVYALRGYTPEEAMQQDINQSLTPSSAQKVLKSISEILPVFLAKPAQESKKIHRHELRQPCKDGSVIWIETTTRYQLNSDNEIEVIGISRNIDDRKKHEQAIAKRLRYEENLALFSNTLLLGKADAISKSLYYLLVAANCSRVYIFENFTDNDNQLSMKQIYEFCAEGIEAQINKPELRHLVYQKDGFERWQSLLSENKIISGKVSDFPEKERKILEPQGIKSIIVIPIWVNRNWFGFIGFDETMSEKDWDNEDVDLLRTASEILGLYIENQSSKNQLLKSNKQLKELNATKDRFISILGHDLKSPFNSILGFSDLLLSNIDKYDQEKTKKFLNLINISSNQVYNLLNNLLEWSRSQRDVTPFKPEPTDLCHLINETFLLLNGQAENKQIQIDLDTPLKLEAEVDSEMIKTVFRNLLNNAIKFTQKNGQIRISAREVAEIARIEVADTGTGMSEATKNSLFKIGESQSHQGTNGEQGTGFGLLLCKEFIDKHQGTITVESQEGKGSNFIVSLPLRQEEQ